MEFPFLRPSLPVECRLLTLVFCLLAFIPSGIGAQEAIVLKDDVLFYEAEGKAEYLVDDGKRLTFTEISSSGFSRGFTTWRGKTVNIGYRPVALWVRFSCHNTASNRTWLLKTDALDDVRVYFPRGNGTYRELSLGRKKPAPQVLRRFGIYYIELPRDAFDRPIYIRYEHDDTMLVRLEIQDIWTLLSNNYEGLANGFFIGLIVVLILYNLLLFIFLRDSSYIYYSVFVLAMFVVTLIFTGIILNFIPPDTWFSVDKLETVALSLALTFHILFMRKYLMSSVTGSLIDRILLWLAAVCAAHILSIFFVPYLIRTLSLFIAFVVTVVFNVILVVDCIRRRYTPVRFFISAWLVLVASVIVFSLRMTGVLDASFVTEYATQIGASGEALLLAFGLAFRIHVLRQEKARADEWGRTNLAKAERMQRDYQRLFETAPLGIMLLDMDGAYLAVNQAYGRMYGWDNASLSGKYFYTQVYREQRAGPEKLFWDTLVAGPKAGVITFERTNVTASGKPIIVRYFINFIRSPDGDAEGALCCVEDITDLRRALDDLRSSVTEKELLLKEVHHRVKNNMQIIISLFRLKTREADDPSLKSLLESTASRIRAIANVHNRIYLSKDVARVDAESFIPSTVKQALSVFHLNEEQCHVVYSIDPVKLTVDIALPLSLIINELVTNAITHGFTGTDSITITVAFRTAFGPDGRPGRMLEVTDTGRGFPGGFPTSRFETFGLSLVETLTSQLDGEMKVETAPHTRITIRFADRPAPEKKQPAAAAASSE